MRIKIFYTSVKLYFRVQNAFPFVQMAETNVVTLRIPDDNIQKSDRPRIRFVHAKETLQRGIMFSCPQS
jgi:hypothetical protein